MLVVDFRVGHDIVEVVEIRLRDQASLEKLLLPLVVAPRRFVRLLRPLQAEHPVLVVTLVVVHLCRRRQRGDRQQGGRGEETECAWSYHERVSCGCRRMRTGAPSGSVTQIYALCCTCDS